MRVQLGPFEVMHAAIAGISRTTAALRDSRDLGEGRTDLGFERDIIGAVSEYALSRELDRCWRPAVGRLDTDTGDVAGVQARATARDTGKLIIRPGDPDAHRYVLALVERQPPGLAVDFVGWTIGSDAKVDGYRSAPSGRPPAWFVPQHALRPLYDFDELLQ